jgi:hypothetical protein
LAGNNQIGYFRVATAGKIGACRIIALAVIVAGAILLTLLAASSGLSGRPRTSADPPAPALPQWGRPGQATSTAAAPRDRPGLRQPSSTASAEPGPNFNRKWHLALCQGQVRREIKVLRRLSRPVEAA